MQSKSSRISSLQRYSEKRWKRYAGSPFSCYPSNGFVHIDTRDATPLGKANLCGIPHEVEADAEMSAKAEDAAKACEKHGGLSHDIGHSTDKCNLAGGSGMVNSVAQYINDHGEKNRERRGHRAWCLNPPMDKVGFGEAGGGYSAMWCMESYLVELF